MKTTTFVFLVMCALLIGCKSATSPLTEEEKKIVGKYYTTISKDMEKTDTTPEGTIMLELYTTYRTDRVCEQTGTCMFVVKGIDVLKQPSLGIKFDVAVKSDWRVENGYLKGNTDPESIKWKFVEANAETEEAKMFVKLLKTAFPTLSFGMKIALMELGEDTRIVELTDEKLVIEQGGEQFTNVRMK